MSQQHLRHYTAIALGGLATIGLWEGAKGVLLPHFQAELALSATAAASIFSASAIGTFTGSFAFGPLSQRFGLKRVSAFGAALLVLLVGLFLALRNPVFLYGAFVVWGLAVSTIELGTHLPISLLYSEKQGGILNLLHGFFGIGALAGSLWGAIMLALGAGWRASVALVGAGLILWVLYFLRLPAVPIPRPSDEQSSYGPVVRDPLIWATALALVAAVAGEIGVGLFLPSYLQKVKGLSEGISAMGATLFFVGFTLTRLAGTWLVTRFGNVQALIGSAVVGAAGLLGLILLPGNWAWLSVLPGAGIAIGFATCLTLAALRHPHRVNTVYSLMYAGGGLAGILTGPFIGWVGDSLGLATAMWVPLAFYLMIILLISLYSWSQGKREGYRIRPAS